MSLEVQEVLPLDNVNIQTLMSVMSAEMFHHGLNERVCLIVACSFVNSMVDADDVTDFGDRFAAGLGEIILEVKGHDIERDELEPELISKALVSAGYLTPSGGIGSRLGELASLRKEAYPLIPADETFVRRYGEEQFRGSLLAEEAIHALEATKTMINTRMLDLAQLVQAKLGVADPEGYVITGCLSLIPGKAYICEFRMERRGRANQMSCHAYNSQAGDRSRALQDLYGVSRDYDPDVVLVVIMDEVMDMVTDLDEAVADLKSLGEVNFIIKHLEKGTNVKKPFSFVKASWYLKDLKAGNRPYIGMGFGLDAKCSGLQIASLLVGDQKMAAACGFAYTDQMLDDAYILALKSVEEAGITGLDRLGIKGAVLAIIYGMGWRRFTDIAYLLKDDKVSMLVPVLYPDGKVHSDEVAKKFHKAIEKSFGRALIGTRDRMKGYGKLSKGRTKHLMPDGFEIAMNYKVCLNALGEPMGYDVLTPDVTIQNNSNFYKFINYKVTTKVTNEIDFARNGFVNLIQGVDGLLARMIVVNLKRAGVEGIYSVHDCFRVDVHSMDALKKAIMLAYMDLFGGEWNNSTSDLPMGVDILQLYFQGANRQVIDEINCKMVSQFFPPKNGGSVGKRRMRKVGGVKLSKLINDLGTTYYFAK